MALGGYLAIRGCPNGIFFVAQPGLLLCRPRPLFVVSDPIRVLLSGCADDIRDEARWRERWWSPGTQLISIWLGTGVGCSG